MNQSAIHGPGGGAGGLNDTNDEDLPPPVLEWALPSAATIVLADGFTEVTGLLKGSATELVAVADNFIFRNLDECLAALDGVAKTLAVAETDLPLSTISHALRRLGAPLSVVTGPLYLWSHMDASEHAASARYAFVRAGAGAAAAGLGDHSPEHAASDYRRLLRGIASKHLLDMLVASGGRLETALTVGLKAATLPRPGPRGGYAATGGWSGGAATLAQAAVPVLAVSVADALVCVARDFAGGGMADGTGRRRSGFGHAINGNRGRHPLWWSSPQAFTGVAGQWLADVAASFPGGPRSSSSRFEDPAEAAEALKAHVQRAVAVHREASARSRRVESSFRTPEAAEALLLKPQVRFGPGLPGEGVCADGGAVGSAATALGDTRRPGSPGSPQRPGSPGAAKGVPQSWLSPIKVRGGSSGGRLGGADGGGSVYDDDDDDEDGGGGLSSGAGAHKASGGVLQDRMCYFIIGNLHRLRAELRDRGLLARGGPGDHTAVPGTVVTVATVVRALQVATGCPYPAPALAALIAAAVDPPAHQHQHGRAAPVRVHDGGIWDLPVDVALLEAQLDDHLMRL